MKVLDKFSNGGFAKKRFCSRLFSISLAWMLLVPMACKKTPVNIHRGDALDLYRKSVRMIKLYTDSLQAAPDSATLLNIEERFSDAMTDLNFDYPSETCLEISEGENDTLTSLTERFIFLRDSLLIRYANPIEVNDSIASDSIAKN